jgi:hypothetical protein
MPLKCQKHNYFSEEQCTTCSAITKTNRQRIEAGEGGEDISKFWKENDMHPSPIPHALQNLTWAEKILIARAVSCTSVYKLEVNNLAYNRHVINMMQDIKSFAKVFPHLPKSLPVIKVRKRGKMGTHKDFLVRRNNILLAF